MTYTMLTVNDEKKKKKIKVQEYRKSNPIKI